MSIDTGRRIATLRRNGLSLRVDLGVAGVVALLVVITAGLACYAITLGDYPLTIPKVFEVLTGGGTTFERTVVLEWRLPRIIAALAVGAALGVSGGIFQSITRNPLGSPDIIGFSSGAYAGVLITSLVFTGVSLGTAIGALGGGLLAAVVIYVLAWRGGITGYRLILVGIGVTAMIEALNTWVILRADLEEAMSVAMWGRGTLTGMTMHRAVIGLVVAALLLVAATFLSRNLRHLELGDERARALGVPVELTRIGASLVGVALVATSVAVVGPIAFVALAAPQIGRRLVRAEGMSLSAGAAVGALLLLGADVLAQHALPTQVPVGVVTVCIGGLYLIWLLLHESRKRRNT